MYCFRPLYGESIFLHEIGVIDEITVEDSFRPLYGESIFLHYWIIRERKKMCVVFVPFTGNLYFYLNEIVTRNQCADMFSSPLRGIYISTYTKMTLETLQQIVFVPFTGNLYFYGDRNDLIKQG